MHLQKYIFCGGFAKKDGIIWAFCALLSLALFGMLAMLDVMTFMRIAYFRPVLRLGGNTRFSCIGSLAFLSVVSGRMWLCGQKKGNPVCGMGCDGKQNEEIRDKTGLWFLCRYRVKIAGNPQSCIGKSKQVVKKKSEVAIVFAGLCWQPPSF